jgi:hypothetical protein
MRFDCVRTCTVLSVLERECKVRTLATGRTVRGKVGPDAKGTLAGYACNSYVQVCGSGDAVEGDAVVPNDFAILDGADNTVIDGVFHSMAWHPRTYAFATLLT